MQATNRDDFSIRKKKPMIFIHVRSDLRSDRIEYEHLQCEKRQDHVRADFEIRPHRVSAFTMLKKTRGQSKQQSDNQLNKYFFRNNIFRHFVTFAFNFLSFRILRQVMNFLETSLTSLLQNNLFWFSKSIFWQTKTYHLANQNKLFCFFKAQSSCEITYISSDIITSV